MNERERQERVDALSNEMQRLARAHTDSLPAELALELQIVALMNVSIACMVDLALALTGGLPRVETIATQLRAFPFEAWTQAELAYRARNTTSPAREAD